MKEVTDETFAIEVVEDSKKEPVVVDIWATWCGPCRALTPILEELEKEFTEVKFVAIDADSNPEIMKSFGVRSIPTVLRFDAGEITASFIGARAKSSVIQDLNLG